MGCGTERDSTTHMGTAGRPHSGRQRALRGAEGLNGAGYSGGGGGGGIGGEGGRD